MSLRSTTFAAALALTVAAACGGDDNTNPGTGGSGATPTGTGAGGEGGSGTGTGTGTGTGGEGGGKAQACIDMVDTALAFLDALENDEYDTATADFGSDEHTKFEFLPPLNAARDGLTMKLMDDEEKGLLGDFLQAAMSVGGYQKAEAIRALESVLAMQESGQPMTENRDPENYFVQFFGTPVVDGDLPWGFRFEGHHMSFQAGIIDCELFSATPAFWGASPNTDPLAAEEDGAQALWDALDNQQQGEAQASVGASTPLNTKDATIDPLSAEGLRAGDMTPAQVTLLNDIIDAYLGNMNQPIADQRRAAIEAASFDDVSFLFEPGNGHYRVLGPTFVIELVYAGNNHIHAVWRDYDGDYGDDLIAQHMAADHHPGR